MGDVLGESLRSEPAERVYELVDEAGRNAVDELAEAVLRLYREPDAVLLDDHAVLPPLLYPFVLSSDRLLRYSADTGPNDGDLRGVALAYVLRDEVDEAEEEGGGCEDCVVCGYLGGLYGDGDGPEVEATELAEDEVERLYIAMAGDVGGGSNTHRQAKKTNQAGSLRPHQSVLSTTRTQRVMVVGCGAHTDGARSKRGAPQGEASNR